MFLDGKIMPIFPKLIHKLNAIFIKIPMSYFEEVDRMIIIFIWKYKGSRTGKKNLEKEQS